MDAQREKRIGVAFGLAAYLWWGFVAIYFKAVGHISALEVLAHRIVWSLVLLLARIAVKGNLGEFWAIFRDRKTFLTLQGTTILVAINWLVFIWAVANGRLLDASLGYFINPLVNVLLGFVFLGERLRRAQTLAVGIAAAGVLWLAFGQGTPPWIALVLAFSFGFYGLLRKIARPDGTRGLAAETLLLLPLALAYLGWRLSEGVLVFGAVDRQTDLLLMASGIVTALPLVWFTEAARRLRYATVGFLQYIAPTLQFLIAVALFGEPFTQARAVSFVLIWIALALYSFDTYRSLRPR